MVNNQGCIIHKADHKKGRRHDYDIYKKNRPVTPKDVLVNLFNLGYLKVEKNYPELSEEEIEINKLRFKTRIVVEHIICRLKKYRILTDVIRNILKKYDKISCIVTDLVNYGIMNQCL